MEIMSFLWDFSSFGFSGPFLRYLGNNGDHSLTHLCIESAGVGMDNTRSAREYTPMALSCA